MATKKTTDVAASAKNGVVSAEGAVPAYLKGATEGAGRGSENVTSNDIIIPRLDLVQSLSGARKKSDPEFIEGAEEGDLFNNVTRHIYGKAVSFIPVYFKLEYLVWKDRKQGGGFRGAYKSMEEAEAFIAAQEDAEHLEAMDTAQHFVILVMEDGSFEEVVLSMSRSKMKASRQLNTLVRMNGGDRFSRVYSLSTFEDKNANGDDFYNVRIGNLGFPTEAGYLFAQGTYETISDPANNIVADHSDVTESKAPDEEKF